VLPVAKQLLLRESYSTNIVGVVEWLSLRPASLGKTFALSCREPFCSTPIHSPGTTFFHLTKRAHGGKYFPHSDFGILHRPQISPLSSTCDPLSNPSRRTRGAQAFLADAAAIAPCKEALHCQTVKQPHDDRSGDIRSERTNSSCHCAGPL
jgi:hypothetical protein